MAADYGEIVDRCPWCGSRYPKVKKLRVLGVVCQSAWHPDHPEHGKFVAHFGSREATDGR